MQKNFAAVKAVSATLVLGGESTVPRPRAFSSPDGISRSWDARAHVENGVVSELSTTSSRSGEQLCQEKR